MTTDIDYRHWDNLPNAAEEIESYLKRLLNEAPIDWHDITARAKSITSFQEKLERKEYQDAVKDVTDTVAARVITYSTTDRDRVITLIRARFKIATDKEGNPEDKNPGANRPENKRGYDCHHFIVQGEQEETGWIVKGGPLESYFKTFGGLEIQVRTVAAHAWAEFEHDRRYKGTSFEAISKSDQEIVDQLFGAAADSRRALDEIFVSIEKVLANPASPVDPTAENETPPPSESDNEGDFSTPLDVDSLSEYLAQRFADSKPGSEKGIRFALELLNECGIDSVEQLEEVLEPIDSDEVKKLMDLSTPVTRVRRLDDELLTVLGESYIAWTGAIGNVSSRKDQLQWRFDRVRGKIFLGKYATYSIVGDDGLSRTTTYTAARAFRTLVRLIANKLGRDAVVIDGAVSTEDNLLASTRSTRLELNNGEFVWITRNISRDAADSYMRTLLAKAREGGMNLEVLNGGEPIG